MSLLVVVWCSALAECRRLVVARVPRRPVVRRLTELPRMRYAVWLNCRAKRRPCARRRRSPPLAVGSPAQPPTPTPTPTPPTPPTPSDADADADARRRPPTTATTATAASRHCRHDHHGRHDRHVRHGRHDPHDRHDRQDRHGRLPPLPPQPPILASPPLSQKTRRRWSPKAASTSSLAKTRRTPSPRRPGRLKLPARRQLPKLDARHGSPFLPLHTRTESASNRRPIIGRGRLVPVTADQRSQQTG